MSYKKYYVYKEKVSYDNGRTWSYTGNEAPSGNSIGTYSTLESCTGETPLYDYVYKETNETGGTYTLDCGNTCTRSINSDDIQLMSSENNYASLEIGNCCYSVDLYNSISKIHYFNGLEMEEGLLHVGSLLAVFDERTPSSGYTISIPDSVLVKDGKYEYGNEPLYDRPSVSFSQNSILEVIGYAGLAYHGLTGFTTPPNVYFVGPDAFSSCGNLKTLNIGAEFVDNIVSQCPNLTDIIFTNNNLKAIGGWNKNINSLSSVTIPSSVVYVGGNFWKETGGVITGKDKYFGSLYCTNGQAYYDRVTITDGTKYMSMGGDFDRLYASATTFPTSLISIVGKKCQSGSRCAVSSNGLLYYADSGKTYVDSIVNTGKTSYSSADFEPTTRFIGDSAFASKGRNIISVTIPEGVVQLCNGAFRNCSGLTSISLPSTLLSIDDEAFKECTSLVNITIPNSVQYIGRRVFSNCTSLTSVTLSTGITELSNGLFENCTSLTSLTIPSSVKIIRGGAFSGCSSLTGLTIPSSVKMLGITESMGDDGYNVFSGCTAMTSLILNDGINYIDSLIGASLTSLSVPASVRSIGDIPDTVTSLTFDNNCQIKETPSWHYGANLTTLTLPPSIAFMYRWQIVNFNAMQDLYLTSPCVIRLDLPIVGAWAESVNYRIHVPSYLIDAYKNSDYWKAVAARFVAI